MSRASGDPPRPSARIARLPLVLVRSGLRFYGRHPSQLVLTVLGIALGVAVVVAIDLASYSSRQAFDISTRLLRGSSSHQITAPFGRIPEDVYRTLRVEAGLPAVSPALDGRIRLALAPERRIALLGIDPLALRHFRWEYGNLPHGKTTARHLAGRLAVFTLRPVLPDGSSLKTSQECVLSWPLRSWER